MTLTRRQAVGAALAALVAPRALAHNGVIHGEIHEVVVEGLRFVPERVEARLGDGIRWINRDLAPHTATATDGRWDTGRLNRGDEAAIEVTEDLAGPYFCRFHPHMKGEVIIIP